MYESKNNSTLISFPLLVCIFLVIALSACANFKGEGYKAAKKDSEIFSTALREPKVISQSSTTIYSGKESEQVNGFDISKAPSLSLKQAALQAKEQIIPGLTNAMVSRLSFNNMPVSAFINEVFGNQLGLNYVIEPSIENTTDLVTMRLTNPVSQKELYNLAAQTLTSYGVTTSLSSNTLVFGFSENATNGKTPLLVSGRTLPDVPSNHRPIFYIYQLTSVNSNSLRSWLVRMFNSNDLEIINDPMQNALIFNGPPIAVEQALEAARLLDRPMMQGMFSRIIRPSLSSVTDLASNLEKILLSEGYAVKQTAGPSAIRLLPLESVGQLVVFAKSQEVLEHIIEWSKTLETKQHQAVENGLFSYQVQSTQATHIVNVLNSLGVADYTPTARSASGESPVDIGNPTSTFSPTLAPTAGNSNGRYAVDEQLNTILFSGSGKDWMQLIPVIKQLDKPAPSVLIEVIIAEVTLNDEQNTGIEWLISSTPGSSNLNLSTLGGFGLGSNGFTATLDNAGDVRATLNAFYRNEKANIRSRPRIMVKSGGEASIDIGSEIPTITSNSQGTAADSAVIQTVSYRKTGVILDVKPTVHASGYVDIEVSQELSEATETSSSNIDSPTILNRKIETTVTLRDGGSVLLGGLISSTTSKGQQGIPILGKLPIIGKLFSTDTDAQDRTELMVMIIPYIVSSPFEAEALTDELQRSRIEELASDIIPQS